MSPVRTTHRYLICLEHRDDADVEDIEFEASGSEIAISRLERIVDKRRAVIFEDGKQIADLTFHGGFWRIA